MPQTTVVSIFQYKGLKNKWQALGRMGRPPIKDKKIDGLKFWKPFGTGKGRGFSIMPDLSTFALLTVFEDEQMAQSFIDSDTMNDYKDPSETHSHILMHNIESRGKWENQQPFHQTTQASSNGKIAVITRAQLKPRYIYAFWKKVPKISKSLDEYPQIIYTKGVGEWPLVMQVTFSIWESEEAMLDFSYKNAHGPASKRAIEKGYFKESLFARFRPIDIQGNLVQH